MKIHKLGESTKNPGCGYFSIEAEEEDIEDLVISLDHRIEFLVLCKNSNPNWEEEVKKLKKLRNTLSRAFTT